LFNWQIIQKRKKQAAEDKERLPTIVWLAKNPKKERSKFRGQGEAANNCSIGRRPKKERCKPQTTRRECQWSLFNWQTTRKRKKQAAEDKKQLSIVVWLAEKSKKERSKLKRTKRGCKMTVQEAKQPKMKEASCRIQEEAANDLHLIGKQRKRKK